MSNESKTARRATEAGQRDQKKAKGTDRVLLVVVSDGHVYSTTYARTKCGIHGTEETRYRVAFLSEEPEAVTCNACLGKEAPPA